LKRSSFIAIVVVVAAIVIGLANGSAIAVPCGSISGNLVTNCGFETGDFTGWTVSPAPSGSNFGGGSGFSHSGSFAAFFEGDGPADDTITQSLTTTLGGLYTVKFWLAHSVSSSNNHFNASLNGATLLEESNLGFLGYTEFTPSVIGTGSYVLGLV